MNEHTVEATSSRVAGRSSTGTSSGIAATRSSWPTPVSRLAQEIARLGGHYAHVHDESIDTRHDDATGEAWLHGRFSYMLFRRPTQPR